VPVIDPELRSFATPRQLEYIDAIEKHGSQQKAAVALGLTRRTVDRGMEVLKRNAALRGYSPAHGMTRTAPDGYKVKGVSTLYNAKGVASAQWVKTTLDQERQAEMLQAALEVMSEDIPRLPAITRHADTNNELCNLYTLTDSHVGMLAWHCEGGHDWDLKIAEQTLIGCFEHMVANSPSAAVGFVNQLGDFLHYDSLVAQTPTSHNPVDADGRFSKMVAVSIRILRHVIDFALQKHDKVVVLLAEGNHDLASSVWLRHMFKALYENEPRIEVIDSELPYYTYQHGETMLAFHHGHLKKNDQLPILFASQYPKIWGNTVKRYAHVGHRHHVEEKEHSGMTVVQHSTLAARDAYAARGGWTTERQVKAMTYHAKFGLVAVNVVTPEMLELAA
jgi:hypothetical protein